MDNLFCFDSVHNMFECIARSFTINEKTTLYNQTSPIMYILIINARQLFVKV